MTVRTRPDEQLRRWLAAEHAGELEPADKAFRAVFRLVPRHAPTPGFAERVLLAAGIAGSAAPRALVSWWARGLVGLGLLMSGLAALTLSPASSFSTAVSWVTGGMTAGAQGVACLVEWTDRGVAAWSVLAGLGRATGLAVATPGVAAVVAANALLAFASFAALRRLLGSREELV
jgi:hypothetical protein